MPALSPGDAVEYHVLFGAWPRGYRPVPEAIAGVNRIIGERQPRDVRRERVDWTAAAVKAREIAAAQRERKREREAQRRARREELRARREELRAWRERRRDVA